jgi:hypothetical protein
VQVNQWVGRAGVLPGHWKCLELRIHCRIPMIGEIAATRPSLALICVNDAGD